MGSDIFHIEDLRFKIFIHEDQLKERVSEMASQITRDFQDKELVIISILNGSFVFAADLMREIDLDPPMHFVKLKSYDGLQSTGNIKIMDEMDWDLEGKNVLIVEDIVDSGKTLNWFIPKIKAMGTKSISIASLLIKSDVTKIEYSIQYVGFDIPEKFVVGYGLDYNEKGRGLRHIYQLDS